MKFLSILKKIHKYIKRKSFVYFFKFSARYNPPRSSRIHARKKAHKTHDSPAPICKLPYAGDTKGALKRGTHGLPKFPTSAATLSEHREIIALLAFATHAQIYENDTRAKMSPLALCAPVP